MRNERIKRYKRLKWKDVVEQHVEKVNEDGGSNENTNEPTIIQKISYIVSFFSLVFILIFGFKSCLEPISSYEKITITPTEETKIEYGQYDVGYCYTYIKNENDPFEEKKYASSIICVRDTKEDFIQYKYFFYSSYSDEIKSEKDTLESKSKHGMMSIYNIRIGKEKDIVRR